MTTFNGTANADVLIGGAGNDSISGAVGNDTIVGGLGSDTLTGGAGSDVFKFAAGDSGQFNASGVLTPGTADLITDFTAADRLDFGLGAATAANAVSQTAASYLVAESQANAAFAANHALRYAAEVVGSDIYMFASDANGGATRSVVILQGGANAGLSLANIGDPVTVANPVTGTDGADHLFGTAGADYIQGLAGDDTIEGGAGADTMAGGDGADLFKFAAGDAGVFTAAGAMTAGSQDVILDFTSADKLDFGLDAATQINAVVLNAASDSAALAGASAAFAANYALRYVAEVVGPDIDIFASAASGGSAHSMVQLKGAASAGLSLVNITGRTPNMITGTTNADHLVGTAAADVIQGLAGADTIEGGVGPDTLSGGDGNDVFKFSTGDTGIFDSGHLRSNTNDIITDFQSTDRLDFGLGAAAAANTVIQNATSLDQAVTQAQAAFTANPAILYAAEVVGADVDIFVTDGHSARASSMVQLQGAAGANLTYGNLGIGPGQLFVDGNASTAIVGTAYDDTIYGGGGADTLTGGAGNDIFRIYNGQTGYNLGEIDVITDFNGGSRGAGDGSGTGDIIEGVVTGRNTNYVENTASTFDDAKQNAFSLFGADYTLHYVVTQVASDTFVFRNIPGQPIVGDVIELKGVGLASVSQYNFTTAPPLISGPLTGGDDDNGLDGGDGNDRLIDGSGNDLLIGGWGADTMTGGAGNDTFRFEPGDTGKALGQIDVITDFSGGTRGTGTPGGTGDMLNFTPGAGTSANYVEQTAFNFDDAQAQASQVLSVNTSLHYVATAVGSDVFVFFSGPAGGGLEGAVQLQGVSLTAISQYNFVSAVPNWPVLRTGTDGADVLIGGSSADTLIGGKGIDTLTGGSGPDIFKFAAGDSGQVTAGHATLNSWDVITDFDPSQDKLDLGIGRLTQMGGPQTLSDYATAEAQANAVLHIGSLNGVAGHVAVFQVGADTYVFQNHTDFGDVDTVIKLAGVSAASISLDSFV